MPKRRSIGVALAGWYFILNAIVVFWVNIGSLRGASQESDAFFGVLLRLILILSVLTFFIGHNVLKLKELARRFALVYCFLVAACCLVAAWLLEIRSAPELVALSLAVVFHGFLFFFFTRRRVREQFRRVNKTH